MSIQEIYRIFQLYPFVTTDTRLCKPGSIFFALKGANFDGNDFVEDALKLGCEYVVCDCQVAIESERIIQVENSLTTLQQLASYHREQLNIPIIGITGTNGKTTTKELVAAVLSSTFNVLYTQGNLNNHIGVPLTLLQLTDKHELSIIEMGANHPSEICQLASIAKPNYGIITNVGKAHLEGFGSFEGVIRTKGELYDFLRQTDGTAFVNHENTYLTTIAYNLSVIYYGKTSESFVWGTAKASFPFLELDWHQGEQNFQVTTQLVGEYNLENVLAAIAVGNFFNIEPSLINQAIAKYVPTNNRSQLKKTERNTLIIDAYNANPTSMLAALENFIQMNVSPKMIILGDMKELGEYSTSEHQKIAHFIQEAGFDKSFLCGQEFSSIKIENAHVTQFETISELLETLQSNSIIGYTVLIKGSRGIQLEKTIEFL